MRVAMMVRGFLETPVPNDIAYSPTIVAKSLAEGLQARGHNVTFFGPEGTRLDVDAVETASLRPTVKTQNDLDEFVGQGDLFRNYQPALNDTRLVKDMLERASKGEFDCVMFHHFESALPLANLFPNVPIIYVMHDFIDESRREVIELHGSPNQHFISISNSQRQDAPDLNYAATVYNGIDVDQFTPDGDPEEYLMISGRITPEKGVKEAIQIAQQTEKRLYIAGSLSKVDSWYFDEHIRPFLNNRILFLGMLDRIQLVKYYQKASALLVPIQWQEPFGLSMVEAGACGTPVIAFNRGSVGEIIKDGKTGFIVNNSAEMILAIEKISSIRREDCRSHVVKHFSTERMITNYEKTLEEIVHESQSTTSGKRKLEEGRTLQERMRRISKRLLS